MKTVKLALASAVAALMSANASALVITPVDSGESLVTTIQGPGISIVGGSVSYTGETGQAGYFEGGLAAGLGIDTGIMLTTGYASTAVGPNSSSSAGDDRGGAGDADLTALVGGDTYDANVLSFQFESTGGDLYFRYVFASEEYNEYINEGVNDVFAFLVDGINIATIGDDAVSIDTVNCGNPFGSGGVNCDQFVNNEDSAFNVQYDGFTTVLTASISGLSAGIHTMKLAIADQGDGVYDSAVFIQAGTLSDNPGGPILVSEPAVVGLMGIGLVGLVLGRFRARS